MEQALTAREAATKLGVSKGFVLRKCRDGSFPNARNINNKTLWLIPEGDLVGVVIGKAGRPKKQ